MDPIPGFVRAIGFVAGGLTTISLIPQVVKSWQTRSVEDLSLLMLVAFATGVLCWLTYGLFLRDPPMILWNSASFVLTATLIGLKLRARR